MNIPTAYALQPGLFDAGFHTVILDQKRGESGMRVYFGIFNFAELGLMGVKRGNNDYIMGNVKLVLIRESDFTPGLSVGVDNLGEEVRDGSGDYQRSIYGVVSKRFNLPVLHFINGHLGIGNRRYLGETSAGEYLHGVFMGIDREIQMPFLNSRLCLMCEVDGKDLNAGLRYMMDSGLSIILASGRLGSGLKNTKYYLGIGFTNEAIMRKINQSLELAKRAVKIANEARSGNTETKGGSSASER